MSFPSIEQFTLDLQTLYHLAHPQAAPDGVISPVISMLQKLYTTLPDVERPNAAYELFLSTSQRALSDFHNQLDPRLSAEAVIAVFYYAEKIDLSQANASLAQSFRDTVDEFQTLGLFEHYQLYPAYWREFDTPKPRFDDPEPIYGDQYERRRWRQRQRQFMEDELKPWQEAKKRYETGKRNEEKRQDDYVAAFTGTPLLYFHDYLPRTCEAYFPLLVPPSARYQHQWVIADSGHGKTQLFQHMILHDLTRVATGKCSVIVIDSQNTLIPNIAKLHLFAPGQPLHDRLTVLNPADTDLALNLFDLKFRPKTDARQQQAVINATLEMYSFMLGSLLDRPMTGKQKTLFEYTALFLFKIPGATIRTFRDLMRKGGLEPYRHHLDQLPQGSAVREFFEHDFSTNEYSQTKDEVVGRIASLLLNPTFDAMFSQRDNRLDMLSEINAGRVILINTSQHLLKDSGVKFFGRFMLALIANAVAERGDIEDRLKTPTFLYLDEAYEYIKDDPNIVKMLAQARKQNLGIVAAQQWLGQLDEPVYDAFAAIASIIFAGGVSQSDAYKLAPAMKAKDVNFITDQPALSFAAFVKGVTTAGAVSVKVPYGTLEQLPTMSAQDYARQKELMRFRYGTSTIDYDLYWEITISPKLARDGGKTREHGFDISIPAGLRDGETLRLKHQGRQKPDGSFGHVLIKVNVPRPHQQTEELTKPSAQGNSKQSNKDW